MEKIMKKRVLLTVGTVFACAAFVLGQSQTQGVASGQPTGTTVTKRETNTIVQPKKAPIKVTRSTIKDAQRKLNQAGYNSGPVDGIIGPKTRAALRKFQADQKLAENGHLDEQTMAALKVGGTNELASSPNDLGRGGKAIGHDVAGGHPVAAAKAGEQSGKTFGKKVGQGTESLAVKAKDKVGSGLSTVGHDITGAGEKTKQAGENATNPQQQ
jgi:peptidoglycan hydrolase-like protein with peptidoglycan-binding domain